MLESWTSSLAGSTRDSDNTLSRGWGALSSTRGSLSYLCLIPRNGARYIYRIWEPLLALSFPAPLSLSLYFNLLNFQLPWLFWASVGAQQLSAIVLAGPLLWSESESFLLLSCFECLFPRFWLYFRSQCNPCEIGPGREGGSLGQALKVIVLMLVPVDSLLLRVPWHENKPFLPSVISVRF